MRSKDNRQLCRPAGSGRHPACPQRLPALPCRNLKVGSTHKHQTDSEQKHAATQLSGSCGSTAGRAAGQPTPHSRSACAFAASMAASRAAASSCCFFQSSQLQEERGKPGSRVQSVGSFQPGGHGRRGGQGGACEAQQQRRQRRQRQEDSSTTAHPCPALHPPGTLHCQRCQPRSVPLGCMERGVVACGRAVREAQGRRSSGASSGCLLVQRRLKCMPEAAINYQHSTLSAT